MWKPDPVGIRKLWYPPNTGVHLCCVFCVSYLACLCWVSCVNFQSSMGHLITFFTCACVSFVCHKCLLCGFCVLCGLSVMCFESYVGHIVVASMWLWDYCVLGILFLSIVYGFIVFWIFCCQCCTKLTQMKASFYCCCSIYIVCKA